MTRRNRRDGCHWLRQCEMPTNVRSRKHRQSQWHTRPAFTLIEVVLAMALMVALLASLYAAMNLYGQLTTAGRVDVERAQVARQILRRIERDLHSVIYRESEAVTTTATTGGTSSTGGTSGSQSGTNTGTDTGTSGTGTGTGTSGGSTGTATVPPEEAVITAYTSPGGGIFGDASSLILHVSRPAPDLNYALVGDGTGGRTSDLLSVSWFLATANAGGLQGAVGNLAAGGTALSSQATGVQGLARLEGDRLAVTMADQQGQTAELAAATELIGPEVNYIQFSYFDGASWWPDWDSIVMGGLPQAIEVVIGFGPPPDEQPTPATTLAATAGVVDVQESYRLVIALPLAAPYVPVTTY